MGRLATKKHANIGHFLGDLTIDALLPIPTATSAGLAQAFLVHRASNVSLWRRLVGWRADLRPSQLFSDRRIRTLFLGVMGVLMGEAKQHMKFQ